MRTAADEYLETVNRLEPEITPVDAVASLTSIAISLKRIADVFDRIEIMAKEERTNAPA